MVAHGLIRLSIATLAALVAEGCGCISSEQVRAKLAELDSENRARAEPAMLAAAQARGAALLPLEPQRIDPRLQCAEGTDEAAPISEVELHETCIWMESRRSGCQQSAGDGRSIIIRNKGESPKLVVPVRDVDGSEYARLARRGNKLFVLLPRLTSKTEVGTVTECECDAMPRVVCQSTFGFVVDDVPAPLEIEEDWVPMAEEHLRTICKALAV